MGGGQVEALQAFGVIDANTKDELKRNRLSLLSFLPSSPTPRSFDDLISMNWRSAGSSRPRNVPCVDPVKLLLASVLAIIDSEGSMHVSKG
jgi:hypothetical protein